MGGITITGVKVVGICSKCRQEGDDIPRDNDGREIRDHNLSCPGCALGGMKVEKTQIGLFNIEVTNSGKDIKVFRRRMSRKELLFDFRISDEGEKNGV